MQIGSEGSAVRDEVRLEGALHAIPVDRGAGAWWSNRPARRCQHLGAIAAVEFRSS